MNTTLAYLRGRRAWLVKNLTVWGSDSEANVMMAMVETIASEKRIGFWRIDLDSESQEVCFADLIDNRGNYLPATIKEPAVLVMFKGAQGAFIKAVQGDTGLTIAKNDSDAPATVIDLMVFETGG